MGVAGAATAGSLFVAGLVGSVHCLAMCGPLILAFEGWARPRARVARAAAAESATVEPAARRIAASLAYHAGRVWTYALLGFGAGWFGLHARLSAGSLGNYGRGLAALGLLLLAVVAVAVWRDSGWLNRPAGACAASVGRSPILSSLVRQQGLASRFLLGAAMGLLPCGLVYAALFVAATRPPLESALAMAAFGAGTLPALGALVLGIGLVPERWRQRSPRVAPWLLFVAGLVVWVRLAAAG